MATQRTATKKAATKKTSSTKSTEATLGGALLVLTKSSSHPIGLVDPKIVTIEEIKFIEGTQSTGKVGHRLEGKRTLIPCEHIASLVEFASEEDLWSEPQSKMIRPLEQLQDRGPVLTLHEQGGHDHRTPGHQGGQHHHGRRHRRNRNRGNRGPMHGGGQG